MTNSFEPAASHVSRRALLQSAGIGGISLAFLLSGCATQGDAVDAAAVGDPQSGGTLTIGWPVDPSSGTHNVHQTGTISAGRIWRTAFDSLLWLGFDGEFHPWLAKEWAISDDGLEYTFTLRDDVTFQDGDVFDAAAVKKNFDTEIDSSYATNPVSTTLKTLKSTTVIDDYTVRFNLSQRTSNFLLVLAGQYGAIVSPTSLDKPEAKAGGLGIVGTGPYQLTELTSGQEYVFTRNDAYNWAPEVFGHQGPAYFEKIVYRVYTEEAVRLGALTSGQVDLIEQLPAVNFDEISNDPSYKVAYKYDNTGTAALYFNVSQGPTSDRRVREAVRNAIDLETLIPAIYKDSVIRAWGAVSHTNPYYDAKYENSYGNDVDAANSALDEAGWSDRDSEGYRTKDGNRLLLRVLPPGKWATLAQGIQDQLKTTIGAEVQIIAADAGTSTELRKKNEYELYFQYIGGNDTHGIFELLYYSGQIVNYSQLADPDIDAAIDRILTEKEEADRAAAVAYIQERVLIKDLVIFPLYEQKTTLAATAKVQNVDNAFIPPKGQSIYTYDIWASA